MCERFFVGVEGLGVVKRGHNRVRGRSPLADSLPSFRALRVHEGCV